MQRIAIATVALIVAVSAAWMLRWEKLHGTAAGVFLLDRWTGSVEYVAPHRRIRIGEPPPTADEFLDK